MNTNHGKTSDGQGTQGGKDHPAETRVAHNCTRPPHFPPHCGCPA